MSYGYYTYFTTFCEIEVLEQREVSLLEEKRRERQWFPNHRVELLHRTLACFNC